MAQTPFKHPVQSFEHLIGRVPGLSEKQLRAHFGLYEGYVKKLNELEEKLAGADRSAPNYGYAEISELHRRRSVPFNGAYLHQLYFEALTGDSTRPEGELSRQLDRDFGTLDDWFADAKAGLVSAPGWVLLTRSRFDGRLRNTMIEEHHRGLLAGDEILLALDGWEHAYMIDYGTTKADYIGALSRAIDWRVAGRRFDRALRAAEPYGARGKVA